MCDIVDKARFVGRPNNPPKRIPWVKVVKAGHVMILDKRLGDFAKGSVKQVIRRLRLARTAGVDTSQSGVCNSSPARRAIQWIRANESPKGGIYVHSGYADAYPEVTGYLVPTLLQYGETELAIRLVRWLLSIQRKDGSYASPSGEPHIFDTAQALRGLLAAETLVPGTLDACRRAAAYLYARMIDGGSGGFAVDSVWIKRYSHSIPLSAHIYALPPLQEAAKILEEPQYRIATEDCLEYYLRDKRTLQIGTLTHFLAYELEAVLDLGCRQAAIPVLDALRNLQAEDGSLAGMNDVSWVCTPGLAQMAVCWYKVGDRDPADKAVNWLEGHQMSSGGFLGSYGPQATYFSDVEIPWAAKFFLDANLLRDNVASQA